MRSSEDMHKLTDTIYRHLTESFNPGVRNLVVCGRAYHKALSGAAISARNYIDAIAKISHSCKVTCKGATRDLGEALFQVADVYRHIQRQIEDATKALMTDFITPLENKLENEFRVEAAGHHKRYLHGHKAMYAPYEKSQRTLNKVRKKSKTRTMNEESQFVTKVTVSRDKLDNYRQQGLKLALLDERRYYCYLLDKCIYMAKKYADYHRTGHDLLGGRIREWERTTFQPDILPEASEVLLEIPHANNGYLGSTGRGERDYSMAHTDPYRRGPGDYSTNVRHPPDRSFPHDAYREGTLMARQVSVPPAPTQGVLVRAVYNHIAEGESQLSFLEGDVISLVGEKADGWHYGHNARTNKYGWFPLAFTEPLDRGLLSSQRFRSVGDLLDNHSVSDQGSVEQDSHTLVRRPRSLYDSGHMRSTNGQTQPSVWEWAYSVGPHPYNKGPGLRDITLPGYPAFPGISPSTNSTLSMSNHTPQSHDSEIYATSLSGSTAAWHHQHTAGPPSPPLPPPPPPDNPPPANSLRRGPSVKSRSSHRLYSEPPTPARSVMCAPTPPPPPLKAHPKSAPGTPLNTSRVIRNVYSPTPQTDNVDAPGADYQVPPHPQLATPDSHKSTHQGLHHQANGISAQSTPVAREEDTNGFRYGQRPRQLYPY